jgi:hypothetical protein
MLVAVDLAVSGSGLLAGRWLTVGGAGLSGIDGLTYAAGGVDIVCSRFNCDCGRLILRGPGAEGRPVRGFSADKRLMIAGVYREITAER